jgi:hypothetical protein
MKKFLTLCGILLSLSVTAQWQQTGSKVRYVNGIGIPTKDTAAGVAADSSQILIRPADSSLYRKYKRTWKKVGGSEFTGSGTGSSTSGFLTRWSSSTSLDNSVIYQDNSGNLGLGTAFPNAAYRVTVAGSLVQTLPPTTVENTVAGTTVLITSTLVDFGAFGTKSNHHLGFVANNDVKASITPTGQFNIGGNYTSTNNTLQVTGNAAIGYTTAAPSNGLLVAGNVGVGETNPQRALHLSSASDVYIRVDRGSLQSLFGTDNIGTYLGMQSNADLRFITNSLERIRITSGGRILAATTTDNGVDALQVNGSIQGTGFDQAYTAKTGTYTATTSDYFIDCTSGTFTVNLFTAVGNTGRILIIKNSGAGTITVDPNGAQTIDGAATQSLSTQWSRVHIISDGANWKIISN